MTMTLSRNNRFECGLLRLLILGTAIIGICHGFLSSQKTFSSFLSVKERGLVVFFARKIPEFTVDDENDEDYSAGKSERSPYAPPSFTTDGDDNNQRSGTSLNARGSRTTVAKNAFSKSENAIKTIRRPRRIQRAKPSDDKNMVGTSWMEKNAKFSDDDANISVGVEDGVSSAPQQSSNKFKREIGDAKTFREDFRQTRVFVQGIPPGVSWQDLKDHFREAGNVVFASVSVDANTGQSKGHGIVQFETTVMAQNAIEIMRDFPLNGSALFVRADVQQNNDPNARLRSSSPRNRQSTPPTKWKCANEDNIEYMSEEDMAAIKSLIKERDDARKRRQYDISDRLRDDLKMNFGVFIDDRLKMWWTSIDGKKVPQSIQDVNGDGRWGKLKPWRQIPTTPENDACIIPDMVEGLLKQRDVARREKDFKTADMLLEQARTSPDGDLELRIHDESRTWRAWTESRPPVGQPYEQRSPMPSDPAEARRIAARECVIIVKEHAPEKLEEIVNVLKNFEGREFQVLKRLKQQYL